MQHCAAVKIISMGGKINQFNNFPGVFVFEGKSKLNAAMRGNLWFMWSNFLTSKLVWLNIVNSAYQLLRIILFWLLINSSIMQMAWAGLKRRLASCWSRLNELKQFVWKVLLFFAKKKKFTDLTMFLYQNLFNMSGLNSQSSLFVIAPAQIEVKYASLWNNQSCLSRALEPAGSESFSDEFWFAKSQSNKLLRLCTNIKTNAPFFCHQLLVLGVRNKKKKKKAGMIETGILQFLYDFIQTQCLPPSR